MSRAFNRVSVYLNDHLRIVRILYLFWAIFWTLNGLDKFFNGTLVPGPQGQRLVGWFGVNRDAKFIEYFSRLHLPAELALSSLYFFAVLEILVGFAFLAMLFYRRMPTTAIRLAFKVSMLIFLVFSTGDILFGDRMELWEHGTFMILTLMTYQLYLDRYVEHADVIGADGFLTADADKDNKISNEEFDAFIERLRLACTDEGRTQTTTTTK